MRRRLLASYLVLVALVLLGLEIPLGVLFARHERAALSAEAVRDAATLAGLGVDRLAGPDPSTISTFDQIVRRYGDDNRAELTVVDARGQVVAARSGHDADDVDDVRPAALTAALAGRQGTGDLVDDGATWSYAATPVRSSDAVVGAVLVSLPNDETDERIDTALLLLAGLAIGVLGLTGAVGWRMSRWLNEPLSELALTAAELGAGRLHVRAPADSGPPEVRALAEQFNDMADRIDTLVGAQRRFVADASHQLRTPLTALRLRIENLDGSGDGPAGDGPAGGGTSAATSAAVEAALDEADRLARLLDGLLAISRAEGSRVPAEPVDVGAVVEDRCEAWGALGDEVGVALLPRRVSAEGAASVDEQSTVVALITPGHLEQILDNLLANALEVSAEGAAIELAFESAPAAVTVAVIDHGPGMTADQRAHAFDRFWQGTSTSRGQAGLGLAIVSQLTTANRGTVALADTPGGGLTVQLAFPPA